METISDTLFFRTLCLANSFAHFGFTFATGALARSQNRHSIQFNDDIQWTYNSQQGKNLIKVAVHEIGHVLGLSHSEDSDSIMYAIYMPFPTTESNFRVNIDDESLEWAQHIHGNCFYL